MSAMVLIDGGQIKTPTCLGWGFRGGSDGPRITDYDFLKLHKPQEIVDPLDLPQPTRQGRYAVSRAQIPEEQWAEITSRHAEGESLRALSNSYGVSYEAIRQVVKKGTSLS